MADKHEVLCVKKSDRYNPHERITHIGGRNGDGTRWQLSQQGAITGIESSKWTFYVTLFLHENVQTEAISIQIERTDANRGHFYSEKWR